MSKQLQSIGEIIAQHVKESDFNGFLRQEDLKLCKAIVRIKRSTQMKSGFFTKCQVLQKNKYLTFFKMKG